MSDAMLMILFCLIFAAALLYSSVGHAGASGYLAAMALVGVAPETMRPVALWLNVLVALVATPKFFSARAFSWARFWPFAVTSIPFSYLGGRITISGGAYKAFVGAMFVVAAYKMFRSAQTPSVPARPMSVPTAMFCGAAIGLVSGLTGVGGGIFLSPLILFMHWAEARETAGISAAFILVNSIAGLLGLGWSRAHGISQIMWFLVPAALLGGILGSELGL